MSDVESPERTGWSARNALNPSGLSSRLLVKLANRIEVGQLSLMLPKGANTVITGHLKPDMRAVLDIKNPAALLQRVALKGSNGFAEAYVDGEWDTPDLVALLQIALENEPAMGRPVRGLGLVRVLDRLWHVVRANTRRGSRRNIAFHYDLGNDFYDLWLDPGMTYSSALYDTAGQSLVDAQDNKYRRLADSLGLRPGHHVLEIGCGWGGFAMMAARDYGCRVTAITLSEQQLRYAEDRVRRAGLADRVEVRLQDYRDVPGQFDRIASIEMFEAVGEERWPVFFDTVRERLKLGGIAALQVITIEGSRFEQYRRSADFIQRYIFPGGVIPSIQAISQQVARVTDLQIAHLEDMTAHYAETLRLWRERLLGAADRIRSLGRDEAFLRCWEFYFAYCEGGFRERRIGDVQMLLVKPGVGPLAPLRVPGEESWR